MSAWDFIDWFEIHNLCASLSAVCAFAILCCFFPLPRSHCAFSSERDRTIKKNERRKISYPYMHAHRQSHMSAIRPVYMYGMNFTTTTATAHQEFHICIHTTWRRCAWLCVSRRFIRLSVCIPHFSKLRILHYAAVFFFISFFFIFPWINFKRIKKIYKKITDRDPNVEIDASQLIKKKSILQNALSHICYTLFTAIRTL